MEVDVMKRISLLKAALFFTVGLLALQPAALAGPPLLCRPFDIGEARSLPWQPGTDWTSVKADYDLNKLVQDTLALLEPRAPVIVRMETLRRATIYTRNSPEIASELLAQLRARAIEAESKKTANPMAFFDYGYLVETYKQAHWISRATNEAYWNFKQLSPDVDGYGWVLKALSSASDPAIEFAAALITTDGGTKARHHDHLQKARNAAASNSLLARNLALVFPTQGKKVAGLQ
jgi:hypothetical protein